LNNLLQIGEKEIIFQISDQNADHPNNLISSKNFMNIHTLLIKTADMNTKLNHTITTVNTPVKEVHHDENSYYQNIISNFKYLQNFK